MKRFTTLVLAGLMILALGTGALAAELSFGGTFTIKYSNDGGPSWLGNDPPKQTDQSVAGWFTLSATAAKNFGANASAYLKLLLEPNWQTEEIGGPLILSSREVWSINYGYTYKFSPAFSLTAMKDKEGVALSNGLLVGDDWGDTDKVKFTANPGNPYCEDGNHLRGSTGSSVILKTDLKPAPGFTVTAALDPFPNEAVFGGPRYLLKGEYITQGFKIGGGYGHGILAISGYPSDCTDSAYGSSDAEYDVFDDYDLYAEVSFSGLSIYGEIARENSGKTPMDEHLLKITYIGPFEATLLYANVDDDGGITAGDRTDLPFRGDKVYRAESIDLAVNYKIGHLTLGGGTALDRDFLIMDVFAKLAYGRFTAVASYDFVNDTLSLYGACKIDGTNSIELGYNLDSGVYEVKLYVSMW